MDIDSVYIAYLLTSDPTCYLLFSALHIPWYFVECVTVWLKGEDLRISVWSLKINNFICILAPLRNFWSIRSLWYMSESLWLESQKYFKKERKRLHSGRKLNHCKNR